LLEGKVDDLRFGGYLSEEIDELPKSSPRIMPLSFQTFCESSQRVAKIASARQLHTHQPLSRSSLNSVDEVPSAIVHG
jgi:hypothetical protein